MTVVEPGASSFWCVFASPNERAAYVPLPTLRFITPSNAWWDVTRYFKDKLKTEVDWEDTALSVQQMASLPCPLYICQQFEGDLLITPRRSCYQAINHGGLTIRTSWPRMSLEGLEEAIQWECPMYRRCDLMGDACTPLVR